MSSPPPQSEPGSADDGTGSSTTIARPLERRATVGEAPSPSCHRWRPRSKSVSNACERCRRRKIRCDGESGPCSTCIRFCVACVRPPKLKDRVGVGAHRALASRIQYLEAQLAEMGDVQTAATPVWHEDLWNSTPSTPRPAQPSLHVDTSFEMPQRSFSFDFAPSTPAESAAQPDIPTIEISDCGGPSPTMLSPAPSLLSANSRCSTPEPYSITTPIMGSALVPPMFGSPVSPPVSACQRPPWENCSHGEANEGGYLSPPDHGKQSFSRRSSISSLGLDQDFNSISLQFSPFEDEPQSPGVFPDSFRPQSRGSHHSTTPTGPGTMTPKMPTKFEAETLSDIFFEKTEHDRRPVEHSFYQTCLDLVYDLSSDSMQSQDTSLVELLITPYSLRMARFYVFMTMAVGMRLRTGGRMTDNSLLDTCYRLAMQQTETASFWSEVGGVEAASLLALFARSGDPHAVDKMDH
ncbi:putative c6 zinc finger domain protein [Neofusicoccum parvum UCRNP2]|uniref:Putative c6 zinc finger domain protein n=1 Tax=Botryosphaeria parva (strain UCR-NP2) TaxID=1287680 RepID=R1EV40_BOTPV|nr:putative c6 zinc finger domain protein [Neofusicoccum parvum UCRNP2]